MATRTKSETATQAYRRNLKEAKDLMEKIDRIRTYRARNILQDKPDFADVGDWAYVNEMLQRTLNFLTGEDD